MLQLSSRMPAKTHRQAYRNGIRIGIENFHIAVARQRENSHAAMLLHGKNETPSRFNAAPAHDLRPR